MLYFFILNFKMDISDYPDYMITRDGRVFSKKSGGYRSLRPYDNGHGYLQLRLCNDGNAKNFKIHRLVALTYISNPHNYEQVDHIDRNRLNNNVENLRWVTNFMNMQNQGEYKNNKSGYKNISYDKSQKRWKYKKVINGVPTQKNFKSKIDILCYKYIILLKIRSMSQKTLDRRN